MPAIASALVPIVVENVQYDPSVEHCELRLRWVTVVCQIIDFFHVGSQLRRVLVQGLAVTPTSSKPSERCLSRGTATEKTLTGPVGVAPDALTAQSPASGG